MNNLKIMENQKDDKIEKITFTLKHVNEHNIIPAINKIMNAPIQPTYPTAYWVGKMGKKLLTEIKTSQEKYAQKLDDSCEKDEKGQVKRETDGRAMLKEDQKEVFDKWSDEFLESTIVIETMKFAPNELAAAKLTPADLLALEPILAV